MSEKKLNGMQYRLQPAPDEQHPTPNNNPKPPKKVHRFYLGHSERYIVISSDFESGNIELIKQLSEFQYRLASVPDNYGTKYQGNSKGWFYFSVTGYPQNTRGKFYIERLNVLASIYHSKYSSAYRPVYKVSDGPWERLPTEASLHLKQPQNLELIFDYIFRSEHDVVYFAFCYPFTYTDNIEMLRELEDNLDVPDLYYHKQVLTMSSGGRMVHLLTITSKDQQDSDVPIQQRFDSIIFPQNNRPKRFRKPTVLITARVHPAETPSSFSLRGILRFLTDKTDLRAFLLRRMFTFMIVPMINVDGVEIGHFRMDTIGQNLNRYYLNPDPNKQPAVYAIKRLSEHLHSDRRLWFYFDLHAHNAKKGCFIYGNAINDFVDQVESQVFCKLFSMNTKSFEYSYCNFSMKHMKARDRFEDLTKEGCGRVVMHKTTGMIHSFSLECGLLSSNELNTLSDVSNLDFSIGELGCKVDPLEFNDHPAYRGPTTPLYTTGMYENVGKALLVSILDTFDKNPYSRVYTSDYKSMNMLRRMIAFEVFHEAERFRMFQRFTFNKVKNINELMVDNFKVKFDTKRIFNLNSCQRLKDVRWPDNITGLRRETRHSLLQNKDSRTLTSYNVISSNQQIKDQVDDQEEETQLELYSDIIKKMKESASKEPEIQESPPVSAKKIKATSLKKQVSLGIKRMDDSDGDDDPREEANLLELRVCDISSLNKNTLELKNQIKQHIRDEIRSEMVRVQMDDRKRTISNIFMHKPESTMRQSNDSANGSNRANIPPLELKGSHHKTSKQKSENSRKLVSSETQIAPVQGNSHTFTPQKPYQATTFSSNQRANSQYHSSGRHGGNNYSTQQQDLTESNIHKKRLIPSIQILNPSQLLDTNSNTTTTSTFKLPQKPARKFDEDKRRWSRKKISSKLNEQLEPDPNLYQTNNFRTAFFQEAVGTIVEKKAQTAAAGSNVQKLKQQSYARLQQGGPTISLQNKSNDNSVNAISTLRNKALPLKNVEIVSAKLREFRRQNSKERESQYFHFPELVCHEVAGSSNSTKGALYTTSNTFLVEVERSKTTDLNQILKSTLRFEALKLKEIARNSRGRMDSTK